jgi:phosphatidylglycerophosphate synthase
MTVTIKDIKQKYLDAKSNERNFLWTYRVRRPVSYYIAWCCLRLAISANIVTLSFLLVGIIGCIFLASGSHLYLVIGALLIEFSIILDCVDGHIARFKGTSYVGSVLDFWAGEIVFVSSMFSLGIGLSKIWSPVDIHISIIPLIKGDVFLYVGFFAALSALLAWAVRIHWLYIAPRTSSEDAQPDSKLRASKKVIVVDNLFHYSGAYAPLMVVSAILGVLEIFLLLVLTVYGLFLLVLMAIVLKRAHALDMVKAS